MGLPTVALACKPFLDSFLTQTRALGIPYLPVLVTDPETDNPGPIRRQVRQLLPYIEQYLTSDPDPSDPSPWIKRATRGG